MWRSTLYIRHQSMIFAQTAAVASDCLCIVRTMVWTLKIRVVTCSKIIHRAVTSANVNALVVFYFYVCAFVSCLSARCQKVVDKVTNLWWFFEEMWEDMWLSRWSNFGGGAAVVKVVLWSSGLIWRSQVGANSIPIPTPLIWRYVGVK